MPTLTTGTRIQSALVVFVCLAAWATPLRAQSSAAPAILTFDAPGAGKDSGEGTSPQAMNDAGEITGFYKDANSVVHGFLRRADGSFATFDAPGASKKATLGTLPQSINNAGEIAGYYFSDPNGVRHGFIRKKDGTFTKYDPPGSVGTVIRSINAAGQFTGNYVSYDIAHGFLGRSDRSFASFDPPASANAAPQSVNSAGDVTGYYADARNGLHGFVRRINGTFSKFDVPEAVVSEGKGTLPMSIDPAGNVAGYYHTSAKSGIHGFLRRKDGTFVKFDPPGSITDGATHLDEEGYILRPATAPLSINERGEIAGYFGDTAGVVHGFVRHADGTFVTFEAPGAAKTGNLGTFSESINSAGDVAGYFYSGSNTVLRGFLYKGVGRAKK